MTSVRKSLLSIWRKRMLVAQRIAMTRKSFLKRPEDQEEQLVESGTIIPQWHQSKVS